MESDLNYNAMTQTEHNDLCLYLNEWLGQFDEARRRFPKEKLPYIYARTVNSTLSDLLVIDAEENGL